MKIAIVVALLLSGCAGTFGGPGRGSFFQPRDTALELAWAATAALTACDVGGTLGSTNMGRYDRPGSKPGYVLGEGNPILQAMPGFGERPSVTALIAGPAAATAASYAVVRSPLPTWARWGWVGIVAAIEGYVVVGNARWAGACGVVGTSYPIQMSL